MAPTLPGWIVSASRPAPRSRTASATRAPCASADQVWVSGTAPIMPGDADPPDRRLRAGADLPRRSSGARSPRPARRSTTSCARGSTSPTPRDSTRSAARTARRSRRARPATTGDRHRRCSTRAGSSRSRPRRLSTDDRGSDPRRRSTAEARPAGTRASVLDHAFGTGDPYTLGVEEEYMLLDPETWDLVQHIDSVLAAVDDGELRVPDQPRADAVGARDHDAGLPHAGGGRRAPAAAARATSARSRAPRAAASRRPGTHPFSLFERQRITAHDRYRQLVDQLQYIARRELIFGMHIHVAVDDPEKAIQVMNGLLLHLPELLALSASSPFWRGEPTGPACRRGRWSSRRSRARASPPRFASYADFAEVVGQLERTGCIADYTHIWWDIRPHPAPRHDRAARLRRRHAGRGRRRDRGVLPGARQDATASSSTSGGEVPTFHRILTTENKWLAARYGLEAPVMDLAHRPPQPRPGRAARPPHAARPRAARPRARLRARARGHPRDPRPRQRRRPAAARLEREPRHRRGRPRAVAPHRRHRLSRARR